MVKVGMSEDLEVSSVWFIVEDTPEAIQGERSSVDIGGGFGSPSRSGTGTEQVRKRVPVPMERLKSQMGDLIIIVNQMFSETQASPQPGLELDEIALSVEVNGQGNVSILGTGGTVGGKGGITLKFKRKA